MHVYFKRGKITVQLKQIIVLRVILCLLSHCKRKNRKCLKNGRAAPQQSSSCTQLLPDNCILLTIEIQRQGQKRCPKRKMLRDKHKTEDKKNILQMNKQFQTKLKCYTTLSLRQFYSMLFKNTVATLSTSQHPTQKEVNQGVLSHMNV